MVGHVLVEQNDEWDGADRRCFSEHSMRLLNAAEKEVPVPELAAAQPQKLISHGVEILDRLTGRQRFNGTTSNDG